MRPLLMALAGVALLLAACGGGTELTSDQLSYIDADGNIRLVNADGSGGRKLADAESCGRFPNLLWSPTGNRLACIGSGSGDEGFILLVDAEGGEVAHLELPATVWPLYWSPTGDAFLYGVEERLFLADDSGETLAELGPADLRVWQAEPYRGLRLWSPDGRRFVYRPADAAELRIYSLDAGEERSLASDYHPMAWVLGGTALLVAAEYEPPVDMGYPSYQVNVLDLDSGDLTPVPELDNGVQLWVSPDGTRAAVLTQGSGGSDGYPGLATLAFPSQEFNPIPDSVITYGSDHIPQQWVTFTADGSEIYWITQWESGAAVFRAHSDGTGLTKMTEVESAGADLSPDLTMIAYRVFRDSEETFFLYTANIDGTDVHEIDRAKQPGGGSAFPFAWRPTP